MREMNLIDIGVNLTGKSFSKDRERVVDEAVAAGVSKMIITGTTVENSEQASSLADQRPNVLFATVGVHPHHASDIDNKTVGCLEKLAKNKQVVAIGECGLDFNRNFSPREQQLRGYEMQLELAGECQLPAFLHQRDAHDEFINILSMHRNKLTGGVVHCFTGTRDELHACLDLDLHIGITGWICDERRGQTLQEIVSDIPMDRLMIESDAPYLLPRSMKPKPKSNRNEPKYLPYVCEKVAACMGKSAEEVAKATTETAIRFFALA